MTSIHNKFQLAAFTLLTVMAVVVGAALVGGPLQVVAVAALQTLSPIFVVLAVCISGAYVFKLVAIWGADVVKAWRAALWRDDGPLMAYPGSVVDGSADVELQAEAWARSVLIFAFIANQQGFTLRAMLPHVSRLEWELLVELLSGAGVLQAGKRGRGVRWANGWNYPRLRAEVKHGLLALPYPDQEAPMVVWAKGERHIMQTHHAQATQGQVVYN